MPDIAMCRSRRCPMRPNCYRHQDSGTAPTPDRQPFLILSDDPLLVPGEAPSEDENCRFFWPAGQTELFHPALTAA
ncbi:hypothetical protein ACJ4V0_16000 [Phreatobacter sp. HK31-P]